MEKVIAFRVWVFVRMTANYYDIYLNISLLPNEIIRSVNDYRNTNRNRNRNKSINKILLNFE